MATLGTSLRDNDMKIIPNLKIYFLILCATSDHKDRNLELLFQGCKVRLSSVALASRENFSRGLAG